MSLIKKLPGVFQTITEKKFFDATFDQVFSKKDSDLLAGYLGRRTSGSYNPISDFYIPEPNKNRTWHQLEATAYAMDANSNKTNIFFYDDLLNRIDYYGGNTLNQDRLFASDYYSWAPPIDVDMFMNYQNYYWVNGGLSVIDISGVLASDIMGKTTYTTPSTAVPANFTIVSGMKIHLMDDTSYPDPVIVENVGKGIGIILVPLYTDQSPGDALEQLPWDGTIELLTGRTITNTAWDGTTWDVHTQPGNADYITMERGAYDRNAWSRTNKWYHIDAINETVKITGSAFPTTASRALRPIIQFDVNLALYNSGTNFKYQVAYGFGNNSSGAPLTLADCTNRTVSDLAIITGITFSEGDVVCFFKDNSTKDNLYVVSIEAGQVVSFYFTMSGAAEQDNILLATKSAMFGGALQGESWYYNNNAWQVSANNKTTTNQPILFQLYDQDGTPLDDPITYENSTFAGNKIFSYKENTTPGAYVDPVLNFPIVYTSTNQVSDVVFQNNLITDRYTYSHSTDAAAIDIKGYYYYKTITAPTLSNAWNLHEDCVCAIVPPPPTTAPPTTAPHTTPPPTTLFPPTTVPVTTAPPTTAPPTTAPPTTSASYTYFTTVLYPYLDEDTLNLSNGSIQGGNIIGQPSDTYYLSQPELLPTSSLDTTIAYIEYTGGDTFTLVAPSIEAAGSSLETTIAYVTYDGSPDSHNVGQPQILSGSLATTINYVNYSNSNDTYNLGRPQITSGSLI